MLKRSHFSVCKLIFGHQFSKPISGNRHRIPSSKIQSSTQPIGPIGIARSRFLSYSVSEQNREVEKINAKFVEAREEIEMAMESKETVYFDEEAESARVAVKEVLDLFQDLLAKLTDAERGAMQRSMGMKIQQLKAELKQLDE